LLVVSTSTPYANVDGALRAVEAWMGRQWARRRAEAGRMRHHEPRFEWGRTTDTVRIEDPRLRPECTRTIRTNTTALMSSTDNNSASTQPTNSTPRHDQQSSYHTHLPKDLDRHIATLTVSLPPLSRLSPHLNQHPYTITNTHIHIQTNQPPNRFRPLLPLLARSPRLLRNKHIRRRLDRKSKMPARPRRLLRVPAPQERSTSLPPTSPSYSPSPS